MEIKKSHKADLEHGRGWRLLFAALLSAALLAGVLYIPYTVSEHRLAADNEAEYAEDLLLDLPIDDEDVITPALSNAEVSTVVQAVDEPVTASDEMTEASVETAVIDTVTAAAETEVEEPESVPMIAEETVNDFRIVQQMPAYPGGMAAFTRWLTENLNYPEQAQRLKKQGKVVVSFVIEKDGTVSNLKIERGADGRLNGEVLRVLSRMPRWEPGIQNNEPCRTLFVIPVNFEI